MAEATTQDKDKTAADPGSPIGRAESPQSQAARDRVARRDAAEAQAAANRNDDDDLPLRGIAPYESFDFMTLDEIQAIADERGAKIPDDVWKSLMVSELRANQSGNLSVARRRGA